MKTHYKVVFDIVGVTNYPEFYRNKVPTVSPQAVPDYCWHREEYQTEDPNEATQFMSELEDLRKDGELVRRIELYKAEIPEVVWSKVR